MRAKCSLIVLVATLAASIVASSAAAQATPAFGPTQYTRTAGPPQTFTETFQHCGTAQCQIVVINGNADGTNTVSSAFIALNGVQSVGPSDFNPQVTTIVKPVVLAHQNQLTIELASKPGSFLIVTVECATDPVVLSAGGPGVSLLDPATLLSALPIINTGTAAAQNVELGSITLTGGTLTSPPSLPFNLGTVPAGGSAVLNSEFAGAFLPLGSYALVVEGTYAVGGATYCFTLDSNLMIPPAAPGSALVNTATVPPNQVSGAPFPPQPREPRSLDLVNGSRWTVPEAPFVPGTTTPTATEVIPAPFGHPPANVANASNGLGLISGNANGIDPPAIVFDANNGLGLISGNANGTAQNPAEPSGATGGGVVFAAANFTAAYSMDGGNFFTQLNPTTIFPNDAVGFCCDQIVQYVPSIDRFVWLLQGSTPGGYRLAVASPAAIISSGGTAWTYWNLTPQVFGQPTGTAFDYPDLSVGNNYLYMSWDAGFRCPPAGCRRGLQVARTSLAGIQAAGTITIDFTDPPDAPMAWGAHLMQNTLDEIFWAGHDLNRVGPTMRVFSLQESSNTYFWRDIGISSWANGPVSNISSLTPDGQNWVRSLLNGFPVFAIVGSTRVGNQLWFAWSAGTDNNFPQPHIEMVTLDRANNFSRIQQVQIWNSSYAFALPALATNACTGEVGLSFEFGGGGNYENHVVGFWGDFVAYITTGSNVGTTRFGDYVTIRQHPETLENPGNLFTAFGYGLNTVPGGSTQIDIHYVVFGRPPSACVIIF